MRFAFLLRPCLPSIVRRARDFEEDYDVGTVRLDKNASISVVRLGVHRSSGKQVAIKTVAKCKRPKSDQEEVVFRQMKHENLVRLVDVYEDRKNIYFIMECCAGGGDLIDFIEARGGRLKETDAMCVFRQLASAVEFMHSRHIVHGDIKPSNIMIDWTCGSIVLKLIDFGASHVLMGPDESMSRITQGSPEFMAPECIERGENGLKSDIWSLGIVLFVMLTGFSPFNPHAENICTIQRRLYSRVRAGFDGSTKSGYGAYFPESVPIGAPYKKLICSMLSRDPRLRPSAKDLLAHPLVRQSLP